MAIVAVSWSAPLIRQVHAPALTIVFWRCAFGAVALAPWVWRERVRLTRQEHRMTTLSGLFLATHMVAWVASLSYTSVASAVALVCTQPVWAALLVRSTVDRRAWTGIGVAMAGAVAVTGVDVTISARAVAGDALAVVAAILAAAYMTVGSSVRQTVPNATYAARCYATAAAMLLVAAVVTRTDLAPSRGAAWGWLALITLGPQLLGHTVINAVIGRLGAVVVSVALLLQVVGAAAIAWFWLGEAPKAGLYPAALLLGWGVLIVVESRSLRERTSAMIVAES